VSGREVPESCVHANVAVEGVLEPCVRGNVAVGGAPEPCTSTAVGTAGILLTSPCFRRGLRTTVIMDARGEPSLLVTGASLDGTPILFPRSLS
jgi:tetrahydromethanopterin S-methyltransferase subunit D